MAFFCLHLATLLQFFLTASNGCKSRQLAVLERNISSPQDSRISSFGSAFCIPLGNKKPAKVGRFLGVYNPMIWFACLLSDFV